MKKETNKPLGKKIAYGLAAVGVAFGIVAGAGYISANKDNKALTADAATDALTIASLQSQLDANTITLDEFNKAVADLNTEIVNLKDEAEADDLVIEDYAAEVAALKLEVEDVIAAMPVEFTGYDFETTIEAFDLGELNDNQFEKLGDYEVDFDGDDVNVEEFLLVKGDFNVEGDLSLNFVEEDVAYKLVFDSGLDFAEDSLKLTLLGNEIEITNITHDEMTVKTAEKTLVKEGESLEGITVVRIGETSVIVSDGDEMEILELGEESELGDLTVALDSLFYVEGSPENVAVLRVAEDLNKVIEVGDYFDEEENWKYTSIEDGEIVISLDEEMEEVQDLALPNDFAKVSYELSDEDYNAVKVEKNDGVIDKVYFELESYDSKYAELEGGVWVAEDEDEVIDFNAGVALKDSDFKLSLKTGANVRAVITTSDSTDALVKVKADEVSVLGVAGFDNDLDFMTKEGIVVEPTEDFVDDEDETIVVRVPEEAVKATILVE